MKISEMASNFNDLRGRRGRRYSHRSLMGLISYGICSGCESVESMWRFATERLSVRKLRKLGLKNGRLPCARTLRRAMEKSGVVQGGNLSGRVLHMDGKLVPAQAGNVAAGEGSGGDGAAHDKPHGRRNRRARR